MMNSRLLPVGPPLQNFFPSADMEVTIGNLSCSVVTVTDLVGLSTLTCTAPPGPGFGNVQLQVSMLGSGYGSYRFWYNPPVVNSVSVSPCNAEAACPIEVTWSGGRGGSSPSRCLCCPRDGCFSQRCVPAHDIDTASRPLPTPPPLPPPTNPLWACVAINAHTKKIVGL